jgi:NTE family protein
LKSSLLIIGLLCIAGIAGGETITPDFEGWKNPTGWLPQREIAHPQLGLALSGGGIRGLAHIGVLEVLELEGLKVDYIAGVSMGSVIGALYASGYSPAELKKILLNVDWSEMFSDQPSRRSLFLTRKRTYGRHLLQVRFRNWQPYIPSGFSSGQKISMFLEDLFMNSLYRPNPDFDHLKTPFRAPATDLHTGELVLFKDGDLSEALRASTSFPLVFSPINLRGKTLVDGGAIENIPVSTVRKIGADKVIAVDVTSDLYSEANEPWEIADQITTIMMAEAKAKSLQSADLVLKPISAAFGSFEFAYLDSIVEWGRVCAEANLDTIRALLSTCDSSDTIILSPQAIVYKIQGEIKIDISDLAYPRPNVPISKAVLKKHLTVLYRLYELEDIYAEYENDSLRITLIAPPAFRYIKIRGNQSIPDSTIISAIQSPANMPLLHSQGVMDKERVLHLYREKGYSLATIKNSQILSDALIITIDEGIIDSLAVEGGRRSALNDLGLNAGVPFNWIKARQGLYRLFGTDIYERVRLTTARRPKGELITLILEPRSFPLLRIGARYDSDRKSQFFGEFVFEDVFYSGTSYLLVASPGERIAKYGLEISNERVFGDYVLFEVAGYYQLSRYPLFDDKHHHISGYEYERSWGMLRLGQHFYRWGMLTAGMKLERSLSDYPLEAHSSDGATMIFESAIDTYDRYPFPRSGQLLRLSFQTTAEVLPGDLAYSKFLGEFQRWIELRKRYHLMVRLRGGYAEPTIPSWEKFHLGGINDFSGLHEREVLGNQMLCGSMGLRFDLLSRFLAEAFLNARYDIGQIVDGVQQLEYKRGFFRQGLSLSLALNTLLGPMEVAWGWAAPYKDIPGNHIIYLSLGHEF